MHTQAYHTYLADDTLRTIIYVVTIVMVMEMIGGWRWRIHRIDRWHNPIQITRHQMITVALGDIALAGIGLALAALQFERVGHKPVIGWFLPVNLVMLIIACVYIWRRDFRRGLQPTEDPA